MLQNAHCKLNTFLKFGAVHHITAKQLAFSNKLLHLPLKAKFNLMFATLLDCKTGTKI